MKLGESGYSIYYLSDATHSVIPSDVDFLSRTRRRKRETSLNCAGVALGAPQAGNVASVVLDTSSTGARTMNEIDERLQLQSCAAGGEGRSSLDLTTSAEAVASCIPVRDKTRLAKQPILHSTRHHCRQARQRKASASHWNGTQPMIKLASAGLRRLSTRYAELLTQR
jgi:hypothetical protein